MKLPETWVAADGQETAVWLPIPNRGYLPPVLRQLYLEAFRITEKTDSFVFNTEIKYTFGGYCTWANVIRRNTDQTLNFFKDGRDIYPLCPKCRGKGHPWNEESRNGRTKQKCNQCWGEGIIT